MSCRKVMALVLAACLAVSMAACQEQTAAIYVQSVEELAGYGGIAPGTGSRAWWYPRTWPR